MRAREVFGYGPSRGSSRAAGSGEASNAAVERGRELGCAEAEYLVPGELELPVAAHSVGVLGGVRPAEPPGHLNPDGHRQRAA